MISHLVMPDGSIIFTSREALVAWAEHWARTERRGPAEIEIETVQKAVVAYFNLHMADLRSKRKHQAIVRPRMVGMYLCRQLTTASYAEVGLRFGGKDHSTVVNACKRIEELMVSDDALSLAVATIRARLVSRCAPVPVEASEAAE